MLIRFAGVSLIVICGFLWGMSRSDSYRGKLKICDEILIIIRRTSSLIRCGCDTWEIIGELKAESVIFSEIPVELSPDADINELLLRSIENSAADSEAKTLLIRYCKELGTSDYDGQMSMLSSLTELAAELRERRSAEYAKYGRLYRAAGILFGLMAGIAII